MSDIPKLRKKLLDETIKHMKIVVDRARAGDNEKWVRNSLIADLKMLAQRVHDDEMRAYVNDSISDVDMILIKSIVSEMFRQGLDLSALSQYLNHTGLIERVNI